MLKLNYSFKINKSEDIKMSILVCGGAGYIGSHMVDKLLKENEIPIVIDNLRTGHRQAIPRTAGDPDLSR